MPSKKSQIVSDAVSSLEDEDDFKLPKPPSLAGEQEQGFVYYL
jgi:hypothetical protein